MFPRGNFGTLTLRSNNRGLPGLCVQVHICWCRRYAVFLRFMFLDLTGLLGKVNLFSLSLRLFVSLQRLRRLVAGGVGASVTDPPLADVLFTVWSSGVPSTLTTRHRYSIFLPPAFPRSSTTSLRAHCWDVLTSSPSVCCYSSKLAKKLINE